MLSDGVWYVGRTVSRHMRQVLGGQCFAGLGDASGSAFGLDCACGVGAGSSLKAPGIDELLMFSVDAWMSCGQCHSGFGLDEVEAITLSTVQLATRADRRDVIIQLPK